MENITKKLNPINKVGKIQGDFKQSLNTIQTQGFKLNTNNLSNITEDHNTNAHTSNENKPIPLDPSTPGFNQLILSDASGYEVSSLTGKRAWVPYGTSYDDVAVAVRAPTDLQAGAAAFEQILNTADVVTTGGTVSTSIRVAGKIAITAAQAKRLALAIRIGGSAVNYHVNYGYGWASSFANAAGSQINLSSLKYFGDLKVVQNSKMLSMASNTSAKFYNAIHNANIFGHASPTTIAGQSAYTIGKDIVRYKAKGSKLTANAFKFQLTPQKFLNPGIYELNKAWSSPGALFNGKFGMTPEQYHNKYQLGIILGAAEEANHAEPAGAGHNSSANLLEKKFIKVANNLQKEEEAAEWGGSWNSFLTRREEIFDEEPTVIGRTIESARNISDLAGNQIREFQAAKQRINYQQSNLLKRGEYVEVAKQFVPQVATNVILSTSNVTLAAVQLAFNAAETLATPAANLFNYQYVRAQVMYNNLKVALNDITTWWNTPDPDIIGHGKIMHPPKKAKQISSERIANLSNTITKLPPPYIVNQTDNTRIVKIKPILDEKAALQKLATKQISDKRAETLDKLAKIEKEHAGGWFTAGKPLTKQDISTIHMLEEQYGQLTQVLQDVGKAIDTGKLKYDYGKKSFYTIW
jgi:hypothetical protein